MDKLVNILTKTNYVLQTKLPSYVQAFVTDVTKGVCVHRISTCKVSPDPAGLNISTDSNSSGNLDLTGSPLKCSIYSKYEDTVTYQQNCWYADEENHAPLSQQEVVTLMSKYFLEMPDNENPQLWVVGDGLDAQKTLLWCAHKSQGWYSRTKMSYSGSYTCKSAEMQLTAMKEKHLSVSICNTKIEVLCMYKIYNASQESLGMLQSNADITVELKWNSPTLIVPLEDVTATLVVETNMGNSLSKISSLWEQLVLIHQLKGILTVAKSARKQPILPTREVSDLRPMTEQVLDLLKSDGQDQHIIQPEEYLERDRLKHVVETVVNSSHEVTSKLWLLLKDCSDVEDLVYSLELVLREIKDYRTTPYLLHSNQSMLGQLMLKLLRNESVSMEFTPNKALEILIDIGIEKLTNDYRSIFVNAGMISIDQLNIWLPNSERSSRRLDWLARLHAAAEMLLLVQDHLNFPTYNLHSFALEALDKYSSQIHSLETLLKDSSLSTTLPVNIEDVRNRLPIQFSRCRVTFTTEGKYQKTRSIFLCCSSFIFPPTIYAPDCSVLSECASKIEEDKFHCFHLSCWQNKLGK